MLTNLDQTALDDIGLATQLLVEHLVQSLDDCHHQP